MSEIHYEKSVRPGVDELLAFYDRQQHRITHAADKLRRMLDNTYCFVTARCDGQLIGLARGVTDGVWGCLVECKLDPAYQGPGCVTRKDGRIEHDSMGIGREMARMVIEELRSSGAERISALAHGTEEDFCSELGFHRVRGVVAMELDGKTMLGASPAALVGQGAAG